MIIFIDANLPLSSACRGSKGKMKEYQKLCRCFLDQNVNMLVFPNAALSERKKMALYFKRLKHNMEYTASQREKVKNYD